MKIDIMDPEDCLIMVDTEAQEIKPSPGTQMGASLEVNGREIAWATPVEKITYNPNSSLVEIHLDGVNASYKTVNIPRLCVKTIRVGLDCVFIEINPAKGEV